MDFVEAFLALGEGTKAAIQAGYSVKNAGKAAWLNLQKPHVRAALQRLMDARATRTKIDIDRVVEELAEVAFVEIEDPPTWADKLRALEQLLKHLILHSSQPTERRHVTGEIVLISESAERLLDDIMGDLRRSQQASQRQNGHATGPLLEGEAATVESKEG